MITAWIYLITDPDKPLQAERLGEFRFVAVPAVKERFEVLCSRGHKMVEVVAIHHWPVPVSPDPQHEGFWAPGRGDPSVHLTVHFV